MDNIRSNDNGVTATDKVFGFGLAQYAERTQFMVLVGGLFFGAIAQNYGLEKTQIYFKEFVPEFKFGALMTFVTMFSAMICAAIERESAGDRKIKATGLSYVKLSLLTFGGNYATNQSLSYINYPTRIMFKSAKLVPVMLVGRLMLDRRYTIHEYANAIVLVSGISIFVLGEVNVSPTFDPRGIALIVVGVCLDALTCNYEEGAFFRKLGCTHQEVSLVQASARFPLPLLMIAIEVILFSYSISALWSLAGMAITNELRQSINMVSAHPSAMMYMIGSAVMGYLSVSCVLLLIKHFTASVTEVIKSARKVASIALSYIIISKPFTEKHAIGAALFVASASYEAWIKTNRPRTVQPAIG